MVGQEQAIRVPAKEGYAGLTEQGYRERPKEGRWPEGLVPMKKQYPVKPGWRKWNIFNKEAKEKGYCTRCKRRKPGAKHRLCIDCLRLSRHVREQRRDAGVCWMCGAPKKPEYTRCDKCRLKYKNISRRWQRENREYVNSRERERLELQSMGIASEKRKGREWK